MLTIFTWNQQVICTWLGGFSDRVKTYQLCIVSLYVTERLYVEENSPLPNLTQPLLFE